MPMVYFILNDVYGKWFEVMPKSLLKVDVYGNYFTLYLE
jgi:hypothetical protein